MTARLPHLEAARTAEKHPDRQRAVSTLAMPDGLAHLFDYNEATNEVAGRCDNSPGRGQHPGRGAVMAKRTCSVDGCEKPHYARGWCMAHYHRQWRAGRLKPLPRPTEAERFWAKVDKSGDCWQWTSTINAGGYGTFKAGRTVSAHRWAYEALVGRDGQPVAGQSDYKVEAHKSTGFQVSAHIRCEGPHRARLMSVRSLHADVPANGLELPDKMPLEHVVFDVLGAGGAFGESSAVAPVDGRPAIAAKNELVALCRKTDHDDPTAFAADLWRQAGLPVGKLKPSDEITTAQWDALTLGVELGAVPDVADDDEADA